MLHVHESGNDIITQHNISSDYNQFRYLFDNCVEPKEKGQ